MKKVIVGLLIIFMTFPLAGFEVRAEEMQFHLETDRTSYCPGEAITFRLELTNTSSVELRLQFSSSQHYDLEVTGPNSFFWRWSKGRAFLDMVTSLLIAPGDKKIFEEVWNIPLNAPPGTYTARATLTAQNYRLISSCTFQINEGSPAQSFYFQDERGDVIICSVSNPELAQKLSSSDPRTSLALEGRVREGNNPPWHFQVEFISLLEKAENPPSLSQIEKDISSWQGQTASFSGFILGSCKPLPFSDIEGSQSQYAVLALLNRNIVNGYPDGTFRPSGYLTRAEFAKMIILALGLPLSSSNAPSYSDLTKDHWAYTYIESASKVGLFRGFPDGAFRPDQFLTKEEVITVICRNSGWQLFYPEKGRFADLPSDHWAYPYVETALKMGFISKELAPAGYWGPGLPIERGQTAILISRLLHLFTKGASNLILRSDKSGGLVAPEAIRQHVPAFSLYGDGSFIAYRGGFIRQGKMELWQILDLFTFLDAFGFFKMQNAYKPSPTPADVLIAYINIKTDKEAKEVTEYGWGAPAEFNYLYCFLNQMELPQTVEYIPQKSTLYVYSLGPQETLTPDQRSRLVELPEDFLKGILPLAELAKKTEGYPLTGELYSLIAPLLGAHERVIVVIEEKVAYSLLVEITLP